MSLYKDLSNAQLLDTMESTAQYAALSPDDCSTMFAVFVAESAGEDGVDDILEEMADMTTLESASIGGYDEVMERTIVKLDKRAKKNQLYKTALYTVARNENDPDYKKLVTLWQMEKYINRKLEKRYGTKAKAYMKEMQRQAKARASAPKVKDHPVVKKMISGLTRSEKETKKAKTLGSAPKGLMSKGNSIMGQLGSKIGR